MTGAITTNSTFDGVDIATRDGVLTSTTATAAAALPKTGGAMTGAITTNSTFDGRDVAADGVLATNALPKSGGAMTGAITTNSTFDGVDVAAAGTLATNAMPKSGGAFTGAVTTNSTIDGRDVAADGVLATAALPKSGGAMTGAITTNSTFDGVDVAAASVLATAALPKGGGTLTGAVVGSTDTDTSNTGSVTLDFSTNQNFVLTLTGNTTLANPTTETAGQSGFIVLIQDGTGSRTLGIGDQFFTPGNEAITLSSGAADVDIIPYVVQAAGKILLGVAQLDFS